jgi:hypothetical protein
MILADSALSLNLIPLLATLAVMLGAGSLLARWLLPAKQLNNVASNLPVTPRRTAWGWSFLLGATLVVLLLECPLIVNGKLTRYAFLAVIGTCTAMSLVELFLRFRERHNRTIRGNAFWRTLCGWLVDLPLLPRMIAILCVANFLWFAAVESPITFDARSIYGLKARLLYDGVSLNGEDFRDLDRVHFNANYPLMLPLLEATLFSAQGSQQDFGMQLLFAAFVLACASVLVDEIRRFEPPHRAALWGCCFLLMPLALMPNEGAGLSGSADFALAAFVTAGVIAMGRWLAKPCWRAAVLAGLMSGAAILTKQEGSIWLAALCAALVIVVLLRRIRVPLRSLTTVGCTLGIAGGCALITLINRRGIPASPYIRGYADALHWNWLVHVWQRPLFILRFAIKQLTATSMFNFIWPFLAGALLLLRRPQRPAAVSLWRCTALLIAIAYFAIFTITPLHLEYQLRTAFYRLALHVLPLLTLIGAEQLTAAGLSRQLEWIFNAGDTAATDQPPQAQIIVQPTIAGINADAKFVAPARLAKSEIDRAA